MHKRHQMFFAQKQLEEQELDGLIELAKKEAKIYNGKGEYNKVIEYDGVSQEAKDLILDILDGLVYQDHKFYFAIAVIEFLPRWQVRSMQYKLEQAVQVSNDSYLGDSSNKKLFRETLLNRMRFSKEEKLPELSCLVM